MQIRAANKEDIPAIVELLKESLGEVSSEKSGRYWRWKHVENPFGESPVLVAEEAGQLIGVRAFMRWGWEKAGASFSALRAVDTATHPEHQGKGIFKKLTLALLDQCTREGDHFIFNTPNEKSRPGYLKMGWQEIGKIPVRLAIRRPWNMLRRSTVDPESAAAVAATLQAYRLDSLWNSGIPEVLCKGRAPGESLYTPLSPQYLRWRYGECPVMTYYGIWSPHFLIIFYIKSGARGKELRLVECIGSDHSTPADKKAMRKRFKDLIKTIQPDYMSIAPSDHHPMLHSLLNKTGFLPALKIGPVLTFRPLNSQAGDFLNIKNWEYSLGTFELF